MPQKKKVKAAKAAISKAKPKRKALPKKKPAKKKAAKKSPRKPPKKAPKKKVAKKKAPAKKAPAKKAVAKKAVEKPEFEESIDDINREIAKRRNKWNLTVLAWMDFEDVSQILRIHIYKKWHLYDAEKPLGPWINRIISNQIKNLIRNNYGNYARPCLRCAAAEGGELCSIYSKQCSDCPLYSNWEKSKKKGTRRETTSIFRGSPSRSSQYALRYCGYRKNSKQTSQKNEIDSESRGVVCL